ncbi:hypothetical protein [Pseudofrankia saprophytica]|uniref:hypothetical protein n=1 Tax=Pseudofrankia saprophytica TaxID=298655 RepID=UPI0004857B15|nr:hypothetical protein [Pseudofrankia saprophytica]
MISAFRGALVISAFRGALVISAFRGALVISAFRGALVISAFRGALVISAFRGALVISAFRGALVISAFRGALVISAFRGALVISAFRGALVISAFRGALVISAFPRYATPPRRGGVGPAGRGRAGRVYTTKANPSGGLCGGWSVVVVLDGTWYRDRRPHPVDMIADCALGWSWIDSAHNHQRAEATIMPPTEYGRPRQARHGNDQRGLG